MILNTVRQAIHVAPRHIGLDPGLFDAKGIMQMFDDFLIGMDRFGPRTHPQSRRRGQIAAAV